MNHYDYQISRHIEREGYPFYALLGALIRQADSDNLAKLEQAFPTEVEIFKQRYNNQGGLSDAELSKLFTTE
jgi:hypothetical protein